MGPERDPGHGHGEARGGQKAIDPASSRKKPRPGRKRKKRPRGWGKGLHGRPSSHDPQGLGHAEALLERSWSRTREPDRELQSGFPARTRMTHRRTTCRRRSNAIARWSSWRRSRARLSSRWRCCSRNEAGAEARRPASWKVESFAGDLPFQIALGPIAMNARPQRRGAAAFKKVVELDPNERRSPLPSRQPGDQCWQRQGGGKASVERSELRVIALSPPDCHHGRRTPKALIDALKSTK